MRTLLVAVIAALVASALSVGIAVSQPLTKVPDAQWCAGMYDPTRGTNFGPCVGGK